MNSPEEIIVYRSPAEFLLWSSGVIVPVALAGGLFIVGVVIGERILRLILDLTIRIVGYTPIRKYRKAIKYFMIFGPINIDIFISYVFFPYACNIFL